ncbi:MAG TPA: hypothetical protein VGB14_00085, partial [Acidimicrobiales bacterium]
TTPPADAQRGRSLSVRLRHLPYRLVEELLACDPGTLATADPGEVLDALATTARTEALLADARRLAGAVPEAVAS